MESFFLWRFFWFSWSRAASWLIDWLIFVELVVQDAEEKGLLKPGGVIVEGTAGNTGIGLALVANARGYKTVIVIPKTQSQVWDILRFRVSGLVFRYSRELRVAQILLFSKNLIDRFRNPDQFAVRLQTFEYYHH